MPKKNLIASVFISFLTQVIGPVLGQVSAHDRILADLRAELAILRRSLELAGAPIPRTVASTGSDMSGFAGDGDAIEIHPDDTEEVKAAVFEVVQRNRLKRERQAELEREAAKKKAMN